MSRRLLAGLSSLVLAATGLLVTSPGWAATTTPPTASSVTMVSEGEWVGAGRAWHYDSHHDTINLHGTAHHVRVSVDGDTWFFLWFQAPTGQALTVASYEMVQRSPSPEHGPAGMDIFGDGRGCSSVTGRFDVLDIASDRDGQLTRFWAVFEHHCEGGAPALFGEVRVNQPLNSGALLGHPRIVRWPNTYQGASARAVPVTVRNAAAEPVTMGEVALGGPKPGDFPIEDDGCSGRVLDPGGACEVLVAFRQKGVGSRTATLRLPNSADSTVPTVKLDAYVVPARTSWTMTSDASDPVGAGQSYSWAEPDDTVVISGTRQRIDASSAPGSGTTSWHASFTPAWGDQLDERPYTGAIGPWSGGTVPSLSVGGNAGACEGHQVTGEFTIDHAVFTGSGTLVELVLSFTQRCQGSSAALRGELRYQVPDEDDATVAPRPSLVPPTPTTTTTTTTATVPSTTTTTRPPATTTTTLTGQAATTTTTVAPPVPTDAAGDEPAPRAVRSGYWMLDADGHVYPFGDAAHVGEPAGGGQRAVDLESSPSGHGYWVLEHTGRVTAHGDAAPLGSVPAGLLQAGEQASSLSATPSGRGYWVFTSRGRAVPFGDAPTLGDVTHLALNGPALDSVATPSGLGYFMVASDGGIFAFGDAGFVGSMGGHPLNAPVRSLVPDRDGAGYWLVAGDGGIFAFDAPFHGSMGATPLNKPVTGMVRYGDGYLMVGEDGGIFNFSTHQFAGSLGHNPPAKPIVAVAALTR